MPGCRLLGDGPDRAAFAADRVGQAVSLAKPVSNYDLNLQTPAFGKGLNSGQGCATCGMCCCNVTMLAFVSAVSEMLGWYERIIA